MRNFAADPNMHIRSGKGADLIFSGAPVPGSNGIFSYEYQPDPTEIASLADEMASLVAAQRSATPWCLRLRSDPSPEILAIAAQHELTQTMREPFMLRQLDSASESGASAAKLHVRTCGDDDYDAFLETVNDTMGAPPEIASLLFSRSRVGAAGAHTFLGSIDGAPVATGLSLLHDGYVSVYALTTRAEHRKQGYGRLMVAYILGHGHKNGAHTATLRSSAMGYSLYTSMGFRLEESWITLSSASQPS